MGFVFCSVNKSSLFNPYTDQWLWQNDVEDVREKVTHFLEKNESKYLSIDASRCVCEKHKLSKNIQNFILTLD